MNCILAPEDFVVEEIIDPKFLRKFERSAEKIVPVEGPYTLYMLKKRNLTTEEALKIVSSKLRIPAKSIGFAGLKDKFAVTRQYITIKGSHENFSEKNISLTRICKTNKRISKGSLLSNKFIITLHNCNADKVEKSVRKMKKMPNLFGPQRFGKNNNNHIVGKLLIEKQFDKALKIINDSQNKKHISIKEIKKERLKFFINAYQSFLFNKKLGRRKAGRIKIEGFKVDELMLSCSGFEREAYVMPENLSCKKEGVAVKLNFTLPKGSYGTVLIDEVLRMPNQSLATETSPFPKTVAALNVAGEKREKTT